MYNILESLHGVLKWGSLDDWEAPNAENNLREGGKFKTVMATKNKSMSFDFIGTYTVVTEHEVIVYDMDGEDHRHGRVEFVTVSEGTKVMETFVPENENSEEMQGAGWQAILDNFKRYVENN